MLVFESPEARLANAGYQLPESPQPRGRYAPFQRVPIAPHVDLLTISGQVPRSGDTVLAGICMPEHSLEPAYAAARLSALRVLAAVAAACGGRLPAHIDILRLRGYVRSTSDFEEHTAVLDAASEVLRIAWPKVVLPARTAVGVPSLPDGAYIEIELDALSAHGGERCFTHAK